MNKKYLLLLTIILFSAMVFAQSSSVPYTALSLAKESSKKDSLEQTVTFLKKNVPLLTPASEKRSGYAFLGSVQEQMGNYIEALSSYSSAAAIAAGDAPGMPKKSSEQLVIDAVRCALSSGDWSTAQKFLNSAVRSSSDARISSYVKLYEQWSILCKAQKIEDTKEAVALLKTYTTLESMKNVHPQLLLTLWHITGENSYSEELKKSFAKTPEAAIVKGEIQTLPAPFWYFVPRSSTSSPDIENASTSVSSAATSTADKTKSSDSSKSTEKVTSKIESSPEKIIRQQLGLFKDKSNAQSLVQKLKEKGFTAKISSEVRPSGTTYYIVTVDENADESMSTQLRTAGFDCYPIFEEVKTNAK